MPTQLAQHLISRGLLPADSVEEALRNQAIAGGTLDTALLEQGTIAEAGMLQALGDVAGHRAVDLGDFEPNPDVAGFIPAKVADRMGLVPLSLDGTVLHVASIYPVPTKELQEIGFLLNKQLEVWVAVEARVRDWVATVYGLPMPPRFASLLALLDPSRPLPGAAPPVTQTQTKTVAVVEEMDGDDALSKEMVEKLAQDVADEPILLEVKKKPAPAVAPAAATPAAAPKPVAATPAARPPPSAPVETPRPGVAAKMTQQLVPETAPPGVPTWTLAEAKEALQRASMDREAIIDVVLRYARRAFDFAGAFAVVHGNAVGWSVLGQDADPVAASQISIPLDAPSLFRTVSLTRASWVGPTPQDTLTRQLLDQLGRSPRTIFLFPVQVKSRLVAMLYGDCGQKPMSQRRLADFLLFCQELETAFAELILKRKQRTAADLAAAAAAPKPAVKSEPKSAPVLTPRQGPPRAPTPAPMKAVVPPPSTTNTNGAKPHGFGWTPSGSPQGSSGLGRAASMAVAMADAGSPPADLSPLLRKLTGADATARARAVAELAQTPQVSARFLAQHFPGPSAWGKRSVVELPAPDELGPVPTALSRLGRDGAEALAPLLQSRETTTRYLALLTAGSLPHPELVDGVFAALFDEDAEVVSAARTAAPSFKRVSRYEHALQSLRQELVAKEGARATNAAYALGALRDAGAMEGLIRLTASVDETVANAAASALRDITKVDFGKDASAWKSWWTENQSRSRAHWLVTALRSDVRDFRAAAIDELSQAYSDSLGYSADGPSEERDAAVKRWEQKITESPRPL
jgi:hypothetical protein